MPCFRVEKCLLLTNLVVDRNHNLVVYGSWDNWKNPNKLYCFVKCMLDHINHPYKSHYCTNTCTIYIFYILKNKDMAKGKHYYKLFNTESNQWIEPTDYEKTCSYWEWIDGYWNRFFTI